MSNCLKRIFGVVIIIKLLKINVHNIVDSEWCYPRFTEKEGFEPSHRYQRPTPFPGEPLQPLGYFSSLLQTLDL